MTDETMPGWRKFRREPDGAFEMDLYESVFELRHHVSALISEAQAPIVKHPLTVAPPDHIGGVTQMVAPAAPAEDDVDSFRKAWQAYHAVPMPGSLPEKVEAACRAYFAAETARRAGVVELTEDEIGYLWNDTDPTGSFSRWGELNEHHRNRRAAFARAVLARAREKAAGVPTREGGR